MQKTDKKRKHRIVSKSPGSIPAFLLKTYEILENPSYNDIISWNKEGNAFIVKKINDFAEKILPKYFKHNNFASFVRQLNMYDFHKSRHENNENEFKHRLFKKNQKHLLSEIKRKTSECHQTNQTNPNNKDFELEKFKKDYNFFMQNTLNLKNRQQDLENFTKAIFNQNNCLMQENKILWSELIKNKEKNERKIEKLVVILFNLLNNSKMLGPYHVKKNLLNGPELSLTNTELNAIKDSKIDFTNFSSGLLESNVASLLPDVSQISPQEHQKILKNIAKLNEDKQNNELEYNISQAFEEMGDCEKNTKNMNSDNNAITSGSANVDSELSLSMHDYTQHTTSGGGGSLNGGNNNGSCMPQALETPKKMAKTPKKIKKEGDIAHELFNFEEDFGTSNTRMKKLKKMNSTNLNLMNSYEMNNRNNLKNEVVDNDYMNSGNMGNMVNSPIGNDYSTCVNENQRKNMDYEQIQSQNFMHHGMYSNPNIIIPQMQDNIHEYGPMDHNQVDMHNSLGHMQGHMQHDREDITDNLTSYTNANNTMKNYNDMFHDNQIYSKHNDKRPSHLQLNEPGLQTSPRNKNTQGMDSFNHTLYMNGQAISNNMGYLTNIEDYVADLNQNS